MKLYNSKITTHIFSNLDKENKDIITQINWKSIKSFQYKENILNLAKNLSSFWLNTESKVAILVKNNINFSNIIISSILVWTTIVLLDPSMWKKILIEKIKSSKITHLFLEGILYDYLFLTKSEVLNLDLQIIIDWFSVFWFKKQKCPWYWE